MPKKEKEQKAQSLGYPTLEKLIEVQDPHSLSFAASRQKLDELAHKGTDPQQKARARQAVLAYDRFLHFFDEMIHLRDKMYQEKLEETKRAHSKQSTKK